jgi:DNA-binding MarR family transcriptional regulator
LDALGITYPQYLVLMVLWEKEYLSVIEIGEKLILNTNTITPLLKRMEQQGLITRSPSSKDQRKMMIGLSEKGKAMQKEAAQIPYNLLKRLHIDKDEEKIEELKRLKSQIQELIELLKTESQIQP